MTPEATTASRQIVHVDMDAFFASVEQLDDASLRGQPVIVGGPSRRGVVAAASYEARRFGVRSAMPMVEALRRCPGAIARPARGRRYAEISARVFEIFRRYTPLVEGLSLDEAFLDVSASQRLFGPGPVIASDIRRAIHAELQLTASAGVAPNKLAAKIASDLQKPDGLVVVPADDVAGFLAPLPIERMWGIGPKAAAELRRAGMRTIGDLSRQPRKVLVSMLGAWGAAVHALAQGVDERPVEPRVAAKSIGAEETFARDLHHADELRQRLLGQSIRVARRLSQQGLSAQVVTVKVKTADFALHTRRVVLREPVRDTDAIFAAACQLLDRMAFAGHPVRLTGVSVSELSDGARQGSLWDADDRARRERLEAATARIEARFGTGCVTRATLAAPPDEAD